MDERIVKIKIDFEPYFSLKFDANKCNTSKGVIYEEQNFAKEDRDLIYLILLESTNTISIKRGCAIFNFVVKSGNIDDLEGDYVVEFGGHQGTVVATYAERE